MSDQPYQQLHRVRVNGEDVSEKGITSEGEEEEDDLIAQIVKSHVFGQLVAFVITVNTVTQALQTDYPDYKKEEGFWNKVDNALLTFFVTELLLRLWTFRTKFFTDPEERCWNIFDFVIVVFGVIDLWIVKPLVSDEKSHLSKFVILLRAIRIFRILRVLRLLKACQQLRLLISGMVSSLKSVFWISVLFVLVILVSAIFCTLMIGHDADTFSDPPLIERSFGTVPASMVTLFQFVTLDDWSSVAREVMDTEPLMMLVFQFYILIAAFTILSLLTGVVSERILQVTKEDEAQEDAQREQESLKFVKKCKELFHQADVDHHKVITRQELEKLLHDPHAEDKLLRLDIDVDTKEIDEVFQLLDPNNTGEISKYQFRHGLSRMKGLPQSKDMLKLRLELNRIDQQLDQKGVSEASFAHQANRRLDALIDQAQSMKTRVNFLMTEFKECTRGMKETEDDDSGTHR